MLESIENKGEMFVRKISGNWKQFERDCLKGNFEKQKSTIGGCPNMNGFGLPK